MCGNCFGGGQTTNTTNVVSNTPAWISGAGQDIYNRASGISQQPYQPYGGQRIADFTPDTQQSFNMVRGIANTPFNPTPYMNPYWSSVADTVANQAMRNNDIARAGRSANAVSAGAFGGYRQGIEEAEANNNLQTQLNNIYFQAGNNAYDRGVSSFFQDQNRNLQNAAALSSQGTQQQQQGQRSLDTMYQDFLTQRDWPKTQLQFVSDQFRGNPATNLNYGSQSTQTSQQPPGSAIGQLGALGLGAYGLYRMLKRGGPVRGISHYRAGGRVKHYQGGGGIAQAPSYDGMSIGDLQRIRDSFARAGDAVGIAQIDRVLANQTPSAVPPAGVPLVAPPIRNPFSTDPYRFPALSREEARRRARDPNRVSDQDTRTIQERAVDEALPQPQSYPMSGVQDPMAQRSIAEAGLGEFGNRSSGVGGYSAPPSSAYAGSTGDPTMLPLNNPMRPRPATALPGRRGVGSIPQSVQQASAQNPDQLPADTREAAFLRAQEGQQSTAPRTTQTLQDAMRDNIDRGESILMMAAKWAEAAGRPGATAIGSLGEGAAAGLTNLRDQRREQREAARYDRQLGLQQGTLEENRRYHDIESADRREQIAASERNARLQANATMSVAGAAESIRNRYNDETARMLASDDPRVQRMGQARLDATTQGYSAALRARTQQDAVQQRAETADENRIGSLARTMVQSGMPIEDVIREIEQAQPGAGATARRALFGNSGTPAAAIPTFDPRTRRLIMPGQ